MAADTEYAEGTTLELLNTEEIVALCHQNGFKSNGLTYPLNGSPIAYIKYGGMVSEGEIQTQNYVHKVFDQRDTASSVKVPKIYRAFEFEGQMYVVMEYIQGRTAGSLLRDSATDKNWIYNQIAKAFAHLLWVPVPQNSRLGPVGGGYIHHCFFKDGVAPIEYESVEDLQSHINKVGSLAQHLSSFSPLLLVILRYPY